MAIFEFVLVRAEIGKLTFLSIGNRFEKGTAEKEEKNEKDTRFLFSHNIHVLGIMGNGYRCDLYR